MQWFQNNSGEKEQKKTTMVKRIYDLFYKHTIQKALKSI